MTEPTTVKLVTSASYGTSITTAAGGALTVNEIALWGGLLLAALTFIVNLLYQHRQDRRRAGERSDQQRLMALDEQIKTLQIKKLERGCEPEPGSD